MICFLQDRRPGIVGDADRQRAAQPAFAQAGQGKRGAAAGGHRDESVTAANGVFAHQPAGMLDLILGAFD